VFHTAVLMPLVADLAPPSLRGRYMATMGCRGGQGWRSGPILGSELLKVSTTLIFGACAAAAAAAASAASMLALGTRLPEPSRLTLVPETGGG
jgi:hypothetical protein